MTDGGKNIQVKKVDDEKITKRFSMDIETFDKLKKFQEKFDCKNMNWAINDLVKIGLTCTDIMKKEELQENLNGVDYHLDFIGHSDSDEDEETNQKVNLDEKVKSLQILDIIRKLCRDSKQNLADKDEISKQGRKLGIMTDDLKLILFKLKKDEEIFEPVNGKFKPNKENIDLFP